VNFPAFYLLLTLSIFPGSLPQGQPDARPQDLRAWLTFVEICCQEYQVDKYFILALFRVESGLPGGPEIRFGRLGKSQYFGPGGVHKCFLKRWNLYNPYISTWVSIRALRGVGSDVKKQKARLKRYNAEFKPEYWKAIKQAERQIEGGM